MCQEGIGGSLWECRVHSSFYWSFVSGYCFAVEVPALLFYFVSGEQYFWAMINSCDYLSILVSYACGGVIRYGETNYQGKIRCGSSRSIAKFGIVACIILLNGAYVCLTLIFGKRNIPNFNRLCCIIRLCKLISHGTLNA